MSVIRTYLGRPSVKGTEAEPAPYSAFEVHKNSNFFVSNFLLWNISINRDLFNFYLILSSKV